MNRENRWLLPEGIDELTGDSSRLLEQTRRKLLDRFDTWGYEQVITPLVEFTDSLLTGTGSDLELQTFRLIDQMTGRQMGIRADMTPQVARIDAHLLNRQEPTRLCYVGSVLHTLPASHGGTRAPFQVGAELYGHAGIDSDLEILKLLIASLQGIGIENITLDIGHVGIYRALMDELGLNEEQQKQLFDMVQSKATHEIEPLLKGWDISEAQIGLFGDLLTLHGSSDILQRAKSIIDDANVSMAQAFTDLIRIEAELGSIAGVTLHFDLTELRGYHYHTGLTFSAYMGSKGEAIALGGRYDDIGKVFGRARPATGFTLDLRELLSSNELQLQVVESIYAPTESDSSLLDIVTKLREKGHRIIQQLPGQSEGAIEMGCSHKMMKESGDWKVIPV